MTALYDGYGNLILAKTPPQPDLALVADMLREPERFTEGAREEQALLCEQADNAEAARIGTVKRSGGSEDGLPDCLPCPFCGSGQDNSSEHPFPSTDSMGAQWWIARCGNPNCGAEVDGRTPEETTARWNRRLAASGQVPEDMLIPAVSPNGSDEDMLKYLDELLAVQGTLMFARGNYNEDQAEAFGVAILDFMRLYGMRLRARLSASGQGVPDGWKLVPVEPTEAMKDAGMDASPMYPLTGAGKRVGVTTGDAGKIYRAMLAAAPTQEKGNG